MRKLRLFIYGLVCCGSVLSQAVFAQELAQNQEQAIIQTSTQGLILTPCHLPNFAEQVECGFLTVPENYLEPNGNTIDIHVVRLPAVATAAAKDPLLFLAGGPGQAASELVAAIAYMFSEVRQTRDVLLIDQRGTGQSNPLRCEMADLESLWDALVLDDEEYDLAAAMAECAAHYTVDVQHFNTKNAVRDFEAVRLALGYPVLNLYGGSYGTRTGLAYMRDFPTAIRAAVLDGVAPPQVKLGLFSEAAEQAFQRLLSDCAEQTACQQTYPHLAQQYQELMAALTQQSRLIQVPDARSYRLTDLRLTAKRFNQMIFPALYSPRTRQLLPFVIQAAAAGNYLPLSGLSGPAELKSDLYTGLTLSVVCQEDIPRISAEEAAKEISADYIGRDLLTQFTTMCAQWPVQPSPAVNAEPVVSDIATLLLSGGQDPVTPPEWAEQAAATLSNSQHLVAAAAGHTIASHTCANRLVARFLAEPSATLDASCLEQVQVLPFILNVNGAGM